ncbi:hypothetical protein [Pseudooceanicola nanhaiensis]|jgi:hypothetical protein|uniref:Uncharacterized protein n=1 Tax=Pseudooceanicola nanhaiensis TaxID=375761 RepID=A0A917SWI2_9RHOB|nr:hypothetical protein [Pseudooceanicola nanhaiensis]GGM01175.1 hypothetical protein GCM10011534_23750 [Pseudooceanicola nanhaiensis]
MALQLLCRLDGSDPETLVKALMDDSEDQAHAGLSRLQLWTDADQAGRVWILFDVSDRAKAEGWLQRAAADTHGRRAGVTASDAHFLRTA